MAGHVERIRDGKLVCKESRCPESERKKEVMKTRMQWEVCIKRDLERIIGEWRTRQKKVETGNREHSERKVRGKKMQRNR